MLKIADLVISLSGRDKGRTFMVTEVIDDNFVYIADGMLRKLENPKKKKLKHLRPYGVANERIMQKMSESKKITNAELRKMIRGVLD